MNAAIGHQVWAIPGGYIPAGSTGPEPVMASHELLCVLNAGERDANVQVAVFYPDREPVGPYPLTIAARRVRQVRFNDLINPEAIPLDTPYAAIVTADVPVVVQYLRQDTRQPANALLGGIAFPVPG